MTGLALTTAVCAPARLAARVPAEPWGVSGPGYFEVFSSLFGPAWGQKQGLLTLYLGVN